MICKRLCVDVGPGNGANDGDLFHAAQHVLQRVHAVVTADMARVNSPIDRGRVSKREFKEPIDSALLAFTLEK